MGIEDRDYMADDSARWGRRTPSRNRSMVTTLIVINVVVFVLQALTYRQQLLETWLALNINDVLHGQIWRLTTYDFLHETDSPFPSHLLFNMLLLFFAGRRVESKYGSDEFLAFYLVAGILSGLGFMLWGMLTQTGGVAIGASGAAVAVMIVYAMNWPHQIIYFWGIIPIPIMLLAIIFSAWDVLPLLQQLAGRGDANDHVAHAAHVGGMLFGVLYVHFQWRLTDWLPGGKSKSLRKMLQRKPKLRVHVPEPEVMIEHPGIPIEVEQRLDQLLEKITERGESSLTEEERRFLAETSRRYRNRR